MLDQANKLRHLATDSPRFACENDDTPPLVVVTGARQGVGVTTIVANLGAALADTGLRTVLCNAVGDNTALAKAVAVVIPENPRTPLRAAPSGAFLLAREGDDDSNSFRRHGRYFMADMRSVRADADVVVVDAGSGLTPTNRRLWRRAHLILIVTTADDPAVMDCYAAIKLASGDPDCELRVLVNRCDSPTVASRVIERIATASERYLNRQVKAAPSLPAHTIPGRPGGTAPRIWDFPNTDYSHAMLWLGRAVIDSLANQADAHAACVNAA
jgi:MinD-like ATPase involved in chromosome partitioning or flagellar assembly